MFHLKAIFFVAALSVVNAATTVNIYDDGLKIIYHKNNKRKSNEVEDGKDVIAVDEEFQEVHGYKKPELLLENVKDFSSCNWKACDQLCHRLGFAGGVCVGDNCKCDNFRLNTNEDLLKFYDLSANEKKNTNECNNVECENYCQKLGLPSGYCYQDRCICYKKKEIDETKTLQRCDVVACNEMCHRMNYIGGMCRNGSCYCY